ncbi:MAG TPA: penicillin acylase family protein [Candidatus Hydrogenedentes bacterium]|nr:penicillin acylase family protein [Candidatus Hydrogenedentota bacterium]
MHAIALKSIASAMGFVVLGVGTWLAYLVLTRHPDLDRHVFHAALKAEVRVARDDWGVPHIEAENETDAYFALGYVMAQDRLFQMEVFRRLACGELAELLGRPAVTIDKLVRTLRLRALAEKAASQEASLTPEIRAAVDAFVAGVNHRIDREPLPIEFALLGIPAHRFTPEDCLSVAAIMPITFSDGLREDPLVSMLKERHPDMDIDALFPGYRHETPVTIMESLGEAKAYLEAQASRGARVQTEHGTSKTDLAGPQYGAALEAMVAHLEGLSRVFCPTLGSNSWVLGPSRTASGNAILANDPHIGFTNPSVWYEAHLKYGDVENYGYHLAPIPFPLLGHNRNRGWGLTMFANDDVDLYRETFHPDDPMKVMYRGEWVDVRVETETIQVRFGAPEECQVRVTPHGPVVTDIYRLALGYDGPAIAMSWVWQHVPYTDVQGFYRMCHANDCESFGEAVALLTSPGISVSYADCEGNIAWWAGGLIPIRPEHVNHKELLDGASGLDEIQGYVPFKHNPHLKNPASGYIITANNQSTVKSVGPVRSLQGYWQPFDRAARIRELIEARTDWTIEALKAVQTDDVSATAPKVFSAFVEVLEPEAAGFGPLEARAWEALKNWDCGHGVDSVGASIYEVLCHKVLNRGVADEMGATLFAAYTTVGDHWNFFKHFVHEPTSPYWDDVTTPTTETRDMVMRAAFDDTVATLTQVCGPDVADWTWGSIHTIEFMHPFGYIPGLGGIFNIGPFPAPGCGNTINNMLSMSAECPFRVVGGPSTRRLIDFADPAHSLTILPTGNSGHFMSPHYDDQADMFVAGRYREPHFESAAIDAHTAHVMTFTPDT